MKRHYSVIKYRGYTIEGCGDHYKLYHPYGLEGIFPNCTSAKSYVDKTWKEADDRWNKLVLEEEEIWKGW